MAALVVFNYAHPVSARFRTCAATSKAEVRVAAGASCPSLGRVDVAVSRQPATASLAGDLARSSGDVRTT